MREGDNTFGISTPLARCSGLTKVGTNGATWSINDALVPSNPIIDPGELSACVVVASNWALLTGGEVYSAALQRQKRDSGVPSLKRWRRWRSELEEAAGRGPVGKKYAALSEEARTMAGRAAEEMRGIDVKGSVEAESDEDESSCCLAWVVRRMLSR